MFQQESDKLSKQIALKNLIINALTVALAKNDVTVKGLNDVPNLTNLTVCYTPLPGRATKAATAASETNYLQSAFSAVERNIRYAPFERRSRQQLEECQAELSVLSSQNAIILDDLQISRQSVADSAATFRQCEDKKLEVLKDKSTYIRSVLNDTLNLYEASLIDRATETFDQ